MLANPLLLMERVARLELVTPTLARCPVYPRCHSPPYLLFPFQMVIAFLRNAVYRPLSLVSALY
jgi:hypothetical protein